ncbi:MAG: hypothetical protein A2Z04_08240 [Chloroflexi bacterium RBG_16_57_9]|nr:MAG: hypothetical protein A2Z04_08240 [Chloroflexi bacterium RBG_16_57_9]
MFFGEYDHNLDDKGRLIIPARFRTAFEEGMFVTRGLDGCLFAFTPQDWENIAGKLNNLPLTQGDARYFNRMMFSGSLCQLDKQGRILLPGSLRQHAGIELNGEVTVVGVNNRVEIWNRQRWTEATARMETDSTAFAEKLHEVGI